MCSSYRVSWLLTQSMNQLERVFEKWITCQVSIDDMHFGFRYDKGSTDAIFFIMRQVQERHQARNRVTNFQMCLQNCQFHHVRIE